MSGAPDTDNREKPDLTKPVRITGVNQAIALLDQKTNKALTRSKFWGGVAMTGAVVTVGMLVFAGAPVLAGAATLAAGAVAGYEKVRAETAKEIRRELRRHPGHYSDQHKDEQNGPDLSAPVKVTGMNKALAMLDRRKNAALKSTKTWGKVTAWAAGLVAATAFFNMTPVITAGFLAVSAAVTAAKYIRGRELNALKREFNGHADPHIPEKTKTADNTAAPRKTVKAASGKQEKKDDGKKPWKPVPGIYGQRR